MFFLMWIACLPQPGEVTLSGQIEAAQYAQIGAAGVTVNTWDSTLEPFSETTTNDEGLFELPVTANRVYHLVASGEALTPTAFSGIIGAEDLALPEGSLFVRSVLETEGIRAEFAACDSVQATGGIIEGIVQFPLRNADDGENLMAEVAYVSATSADGTKYTACYLDNEGVSLQTGVEVGPTGRFAIFGVEPGAVDISFSQDLGGQTLSNYGYTLMPEDGIAPFFPAFIDLAG
jgi:hypothetical protein